MSSFHDWLKTAWTDLLSWFGTEQQKIASLLYPVFKDAIVLVKKDLLKDIIDGVPVVAAALSGGYAAALVAAEEYILPLLEKQGIELANATIGTLKNALIAQAQASLDSAASAA